MKTLLLLALSCISLCAQTITLRDTQGREIKAALVAVWPDSVTVKKAGSLETVIPFSKLSKETVDAIRAGDAEVKASLAPKGISVTHLVTKLVNGKFRYFFDIRNHDAKHWKGTVTITLLNTQPGVKNGEATFETTKPMERSTAVFMDAHTGPAIVHADWAVAGFSYVVKDAGGQETGSGNGSLATKTEGF